MGEGDIEHAGWALDDPDSTLRRHRSRLLGAAVALLLIAGVAGIGLGIHRLASESGPAEERVLARGTVAALDGPAASAATFTSEATDSVTLWIEVGDNDATRDTVVAGTSCEVARDDGTSELVEGRVQGAAIETDRYATIGETTASAGPNVVTCRHVPFGRLRTRGLLAEEAPFLVERGTPADGLAGLWLLAVGVVLLAVGVWAAIRWRTGTLRPA